MTTDPFRDNKVSIVFWRRAASEIVFKGLPMTAVFSTLAALLYSFVISGTGFVYSFIRSDGSTMARPDEFDP